MDLLHRKAQSYKISNKNDLFCAWRDFNKTFCGVSPYHKWMFKLQISSIFYFDRAHQSWISGLLGVKYYLWVFLKKNNLYLGFSCGRFCLHLSRSFTWRCFCWSGKFLCILVLVDRGRFRDRSLGLHVWMFGWNTN